MLLMESFLEWTRLSIANLQPEKKTAGPWAPREVGLISLSMNGKADTEGVPWNRKCGRFRVPEVL